MRMEAQQYDVDSSKIPDAMGLADELNGGAKRVLHRWSGDHGTDLKNAVALALSTTPGTIARQFQIRDLPLQLRTLGALKALCPPLYREVLAEIRRVLGCTLDPFGDADEGCAVSSVRKLSKTAAALIQVGFEISEDDEITAKEAERGLATLDKLDDASRETRARLMAIRQRAAVEAG